MEVSLFVIASKACEPNQFANLLLAGGQQGPGGGQIERNGYRVNILVAPDISDSTARSNNCKRFIQAVERALQHNQTLVFVLAFKNEVRVTQDDKSMIDFAKNILGNRLLDDHTFPVLSSFDTAHALHDGAAWPIIDLSQSCHGRMFVLHSADRTELEIVQQVDNFLQTVEQHVRCEQYRPYSREEFQQAHQTRTIEIVRTRHDVIERRVKEECERIYRQFDCSLRRLEPEQQEACLQELLHKAQELSLGVDMDDQGTDILRALKDKADWTCRSVKNALHVCSNQAASDGRIQTLENTLTQLQGRQHVLLLCIFLLLTLLLISVVDILPTIDLCTWTVGLAWVAGLFFCWWNKIRWRICCLMLVVMIGIWYFTCKR